MNTTETILLNKKIIDLSEVYNRLKDNKLKISLMKEMIKIYKKLNWKLKS